MKKIIFTTTLCLIFSIYTFADQNKVDSLLNELQAAKNDTNKVNLFYILSWEYMRVNSDLAMEFAKDGYKLAKKLNFKRGISDCLNNMGSIYKNIGDYDEAIKNYKKSLILNKEIKDKEGISSCLGNIGIIYYFKGDYSEAIKYFQESMGIFKEIGHKKGVSACLTNIGNIYKDQGKYPKAIEYYQKAMKICEETEDSRGVSSCLSNIGLVHYYLNHYSQAIEYFQKSQKLKKEFGDKKGISACLNNVGLIYADLMEYEKANENFEKALKLKRELGDKKGISYCLNNIGIIHKNWGNYKKALKYNEEALAIKREMGDKVGISNGLLNIAIVQYELGNYTQSITNSQKSLIIAEEIGAKENIKNAYSNLALCYSKIKDYKKALEYYKLYSEVKDSLFNEESNKQITEMTTKYETEKKEKEIVLLNKEKKLQNVELARKDAEVKKKNIQRNAFIGGFALVLILALVVYKGYIQKRKSNEILTEKNVLITKQKAELTQTLEELRSTQEQLVESEKMASLGNLVAGVAHEINTPVGIGITASSSLVEDTKQFAEFYKKDKMSRKALEEYLENTFQASELILKNMNRTGELVQSFKQVSVDQMVDEKRKFNLKSYLNDIMLSIKPEFGKKTIKIDIDCDENLEINSYPGVFAQIIKNLTLNSIRHGFNEKREGEIKITIRQTAPSGQTDNLNLQYSDNGIGISKENLPKIFDPFFTTNKQIGTGLGLHIVYNLVTQKLKGTVNCESEEENGVLFTINVPMNE